MHRLVGTAIYAAPWGVTLSSKLTLSTPFEYEAVNCRDAPDLNHCFFQQFKPSTTFGYRQFDLAVQKVWETWADVSVRVRADVLNVFNYENVERYDTFRGNPGPAVNPLFGQAQAYFQPTRMFKLSFSVDW